MPGEILVVASPVPAPRARAGARADRPRTRARARRSTAGFSLVEMLVALAVFSLAVLGLLNLAGESTRTAVAIEETVLAGVVADNVAVEAATLEPAMLAREANGVEHAGGVAWRWTRTATPTSDPSLLRVDIRVSQAGDDREAAGLTLYRSAQR